MNLHIGIGGGSGLVGTALRDLLLSKGYQVSVLTRNKKRSEKEGYLHWNPLEGEFDQEFYNLDALVNLSGAGIVDKPWNAARKKELELSRVGINNAVYATLKVHPHRIKKFVSASAIGIYKDRGHQWIDQDDVDAGDDFLSALSRDWEASAKQFSTIDIPVSLIRIGLVLARGGGVLEEMMKTTKMGFVGYFGSGEQYQSWIHIRDLARIIEMQLQGEPSIINGVAPHPVTSKVLAQTISEVAGKLLVVPVPKFALKALLGQRAQVVLSGHRVRSNADKVLKDFDFEFPTIDVALGDLLK